MDWHSRYTQQARWTKPMRNYLFGRAGIESARRILEVGCGTGALLPELVESSGRKVHALDLDLPALRRAKSHAAAAACVNAAGEFLPYPEHTFDAVFCHFLLLWVTNPGLVLREMARVTIPGGAVLALAEPDYGGRIDQPPALEALGRWQAGSLQRQGADPQVGRKLRGLFVQAGIRQVESGILGAGWDAPPSPEEREMEWAVIEADLSGQIPTADLQEMRKLDEAAWQSGERVLFVPTFYAWGRVFA